MLDISYNNGSVSWTQLLAMFQKVHIYPDMHSAL